MWRWIQFYKTEGGFFCILSAGLFVRRFYLITTWKVGETVADFYVPDYLDEASECEDEIITSEEYQDEVKFLNVGATYIYSVSAIAKEYMVDTDGTMLRKSEPLNLRHTVAWVRSLSWTDSWDGSRADSQMLQESSVRLITTMTRETGKLPIAGTDLKWELRKENSDGTADIVDSSLSRGARFTSPANGLVKIYFNVASQEQGLSDQSKLALRVWPSKTSPGAFMKVDNQEAFCRDTEEKHRYNHMGLYHVTSLKTCQDACLKLDSIGPIAGVEFSGVDQRCNCMFSPSSGVSCDKDTSFDITNAGEFGAGDFFIRMDVKGKGTSISDPGKSYGALFIRSGEKSSVFSGPAVFIHESEYFQFFCQTIQNQLTSDSVHTLSSRR